MTITVMYGRFLRSLALGRINFEADSIKGMICGTGYVPNQDAHEFKNSITNEVVGSGYSSGGQVITGISATYSGATNKLSVAAGTLMWPTVTFAAKYLVVYNDSWPDQATKPLILYVDFETVQSPASQSFYYQWPSGIMFDIQVPAP